MHDTARLDLPAQRCALTLGMKQPDPVVDEYRPTSGRQRQAILALAITMALVVMVAMLSPHVRFLRADKARKAQDAPTCTDTQTQGCVGGTMGVITQPPAAPAASTPR